jgi:hypothetical protein
MVVNRVAERQGGHHAYARYRHEATGRLIGLRQTANLVVKFALLNAPSIICPLTEPIHRNRGN